MRIMLRTHLEDVLEWWVKQKLPGNFTLRNLML
nr:MAG TPA: hypothetical protein [Caudoviricetes sp.]